MSQLLQAFTVTGDAVDATDGVSAPSAFSGGIPVDVKSVALEIGGAVVAHQMGLPITANNRIAASLDAVVDSYGSGAMPLDSAGRLVVTQSAGTVSYTAVPYVNGRVKIT